MTQNLELRVLAGLHQGARCGARDGALIGSDTHCDVVLGDDGIAPEAARLWIGNGGWRLSAHDNSADATPELSFGAPFPLGPVHVTVMHARDPWPESAAPTAPSASIQDEPADAAAATARPSRTTGPSTTPRAARRKNKAGLQWVFGGVLVLLMFGAVASFPPTGVQSRPRADTALSADGQTLRQAQGILRELGLLERVRASLTPDQTVLVTGWVRDDEEHDRLANALTALWPFPTLQVRNQVRVAADALSRVDDLDLLAVVDYPAGGRLAIRGIAASDAVRTAALDRWGTNPDALPETSIEILLADQIVAAVKDAVAAVDLPQVSVVWTGKALRVTAHALDNIQHARLQSVIDTLNKTYMDALAIDEVKPPETDLPFRVHSVVGGEQPWVMLEDGTRIGVGGTHGVYRLKSIEDASVVFDGPTVAVIPR